MEINMDVDGLSFEDLLDDNEQEEELPENNYDTSGEELNHDKLAEISLEDINKETRRMVEKVEYPFIQLSGKVNKFQLHFLKRLGESGNGGLTLFYKTASDKLVKVTELPLDLGTLLKVKALKGLTSEVFLSKEDSREIDNTFLEQLI